MKMTMNLTPRLAEKMALLNPQQREAVEVVSEPTLILAGAGSGKTTVITCRIAFLIETGLAKYHEILGITFTNKAAKSMKEKVLDLTEKNVLISTFHAFGARILRQFSESAGLQDNFSIYDSGDQNALVKNCLKTLNLSFEDFNPNSVSSQISRLKDELIDFNSYSACAETHYEKVIARIYHLYEERMRENNAIDFSDLVMKTVKLFSNNSEILSYIHERLKFLLVDEYQDTNYSQYRLVQLLASKYKKIFVVGDPDQCIYSWRGADIRNIMNFENDYSNAKIIKLEENYRSIQNILDAANMVIQNNTNRKPKKLKTSRVSKDKIYCFQASDPHEEADFIVRKVIEHTERGGAFSDIAVLYRIHALSRILEEAFMREKIPYRIFGGMKFYERKEIKDLLSYLRFLTNPSDRVSFLRIVNLPSRGIGAVTVQKIQNFSETHKISFLETLQNEDFLETLSKNVCNKLTTFSEMLLSFVRSLDQKKPSKILQDIIDTVDFISHLKKEDPINIVNRQDNIKELFVSIHEYEQNQSQANLRDYLEEIAILTDLQGEKFFSKSVSLMSIHNAKGLEFKVCFLIGMEEGIFPYKVGDKNKDEMEEERRLCYVAITRAKDLLFLTVSLRRLMFGAWKETLPSRFLSEISPHLLCNLSRKNKF